MPDPGQAATAEAPRFEDTLFLACGLAWCAGAIHIQTAIWLRSDSASYALFAGALGAAEFLLGLAIYRRPARGLLIGAACTGLAAAALWIVARAGWLAVGPATGTTDPVVATGAVACGNELLLAVAVLSRLRAGTDEMHIGRLRYAFAAVGTFLILLSCLMLTFGHRDANLPGPVSFLCHLG